MSYLNSVTLVGFAGADAEQRPHKLDLTDQGLLAELQRHDIEAEDELALDPAAKKRKRK